MVRNRRAFSSAASVSSLSLDSRRCRLSSINEAISKIGPCPPLDAELEVEGREGESVLSLVEADGRGGLLSKEDEGVSVVDGVNSNILSI